MTFTLILVFVLFFKGEPPEESSYRATQKPSYLRHLFHITFLPVYTVINLLYPNAQHIYPHLSNHKLLDPHVNSKNTIPQIYYGVFFKFTY